MNFFTRKTCELLQAAGCFSGTDDFYYYDCAGCLHPLSPEDECCARDHCDMGNHIKPFTAFDLCGQSERARENARVWFGSKDMGPSGYRGQIADDRFLSFNVHRHFLIDLAEDEVETYVLKALQDRKGK